MLLRIIGETKCRDRFRCVIVVFLYVTKKIRLGIGRLSRRVPEMRFKFDSFILVRHCNMITGEIVVW